MKHNCDFCGKERDVYTVSVKKNKDKDRNEPAQEIETLLCCSVCRFFQVIGLNYLLFLFFEITIFSLFFFFQLIVTSSNYIELNKIFYFAIYFGVFLVTLLIFIIIKYYYRNVNGILVKMNIYYSLNSNYYIDGNMKSGKSILKSWRLIMILIPLTIFIVIGILSVTIIDNRGDKKEDILEKSFAKHKRFELVYLVPNVTYISGKFEKNQKGYDIVLRSLELKVGSNGQSSAYFSYEFGSYQHYRSRDDCYDDTLLDKAVDHLNLILNKTAFIPVVYDSTNITNGYKFLLLTNEDFQKCSYNKDSLKMQLGLPAAYWKYYDSLSKSIEVCNTKAGACILRDYFSEKIKKSN